MGDREVNVRGIMQTEAEEVTIGGVDACPVCAAVAEAEYRLLKR